MTDHLRPDGWHAERTERWVLLGLCLAALAWRVHGLTFQSLWRDEVDSIRFASRAFSEVIGMFSKPGENGPLFFALLRPWLAAAGRSEFALRYQAVMAGVLAVPLTFIVARRLMAVVGSGGSPTLRGLRLGNVALIAAALVAANPYLTWYGQEGKMYAALVAAVLASQVAFLVALGASRWWQWALYLAMVGIAGLLHVMAVLVIVVDAAWLLLLWPRYRRRWLPFLVTLLVPLAPYVVLAGWWQVRLFLNPTFQTGHPFVPFDVLASSLLTLTSHGVSGLASAWLLAPIVFVLLCGIVFAGRIGATDTGEAPAAHMRGWRLTSMLLAWIVLPPLLLFLLSLSKPMVADRYVIWIAPALLLLLAQGIAALATFWRPLGWAALLAVLGIALWGGWQQSHTPIKADLRGAAAYVESRRAPGELVMFQIPYLRHTYEYYAGPLKGGVDGLYTNSGSAPDQVAHEMASVVGDAPAVWLVLSEDSLWDSRGLVPAWLGAQGRLADRQVFQRVTVMRYEMGEVDK